MFNALILRELITAWRNPQAILQPLFFFILTICLFPITVGSDNNLFLIAPISLWIALLFAALLASKQLFFQDYQYGILSQDVIHLSDLWLMLLAKLVAA